MGTILQFKTHRNHHKDIIIPRQQICGDSDWQLNLLHWPDKTWIKESRGRGSIRRHVPQARRCHGSRLWFYSVDLQFEGTGALFHIQLGSPSSFPLFLLEWQTDSRSLLKQNQNHLSQNWRNLESFWKLVPQGRNLRNCYFSLSGFIRLYRRGGLCQRASQRKHSRQIWTLQRSHQLSVLYR